MLSTSICMALLSSVSAQSSAKGLPTCQCMGALPASVVEFDCSWDWAYNGKCVKPGGLTSNFTDYPANYGHNCQIQLEPGHSGCWDITTVPPTQKPQSAQANWCFQKWCYIDPCSCDAPDATKSDYFPDVMFYSYATCGDKNTYTALESSSNSVGNAECATVEKASDAHSIQMGLGLLLAGVAALA